MKEKPEKNRIIETENVSVQQSLADDCDHVERKKYAIFIWKDRKQMKSEAPRVTLGPKV